MSLDTTNKKTWCPGCHNFFLLEAVKRVLKKMKKEGFKQKRFAMVTGIGCHAKIFDYLNISGIYGLHGRVIPIAEGIKMGNPKLQVIGFAGDGDTYAEGMAHFIHAGRNDVDFTLIVSNNRTFALTTGQGTPTSQEGFKSKVFPEGEDKKPINPIKLALSSGAGFVARVFPQNIEQTAEVIEKAIKHKGFSFLEVLEPCLQFTPFIKDLGKSAYWVDNSSLDKAEKLADVWDYNSPARRIPVGVLYERK